MAERKMTIIGVELTFLGNDHEVVWRRDSDTLEIRNVTHTQAGALFDILERLDSLAQLRGSLAELSRAIDAKHQELDRREAAGEAAPLPEVQPVRFATAQVAAQTPQPTIAPEHHAEVQRRTEALYAAAAGAGVPTPPPTATVPPAPTTAVQPGMGVPGVNAAQLLASTPTEAAAQPEAQSTTTTTGRRRRTTAETKAPNFAPGEEFQGKKILRAMPSVHGSNPAIHLDFGMGEGVLISPTGDVLAEFTPQPAPAPVQPAPLAQPMIGQNLVNPGMPLTPAMTAPEALPNWAGGQGLPQQFVQQPQAQVQPQAQPAPTGNNFGGGMLGNFTGQPQVPQQQQFVPQPTQPVVQQPYVAPSAPQQFYPQQSAQQVQQPVSAVPDVGPGIPGLPVEHASSKQALGTVKWLVDNGMAKTEADIVRIIFPCRSQLAAFVTSVTEDNVQRRVNTALQLLGINLPAA
jgi:hypothetical protein